jgi:hypothetical protein
MYRGYGSVLRTEGRRRIQARAGGPPCPGTLLPLSAIPCHLPQPTPPCCPARPPCHPTCCITFASPSLQPRLPRAKPLPLTPVTQDGAHAQGHGHQRPAGLRLHGPAARLHAGVGAGAAVQPGGPGRGGSVPRGVAACVAVHGRSGTGVCALGRPSLCWVLSPHGLRTQLCRTPLLLSCVAEESPSRITCLPLFPLPLSLRACSPSWAARWRSSPWSRP